MKPKTEEFLYFLLWSVDKLMRPTFRNLDASYEEWAYQRGLLRQITVLEERKLIQARDSSRDQRIYRLTELGRLQALGGRDPQPQWSRLWDGHWRLVMFDVPETQATDRVNLRRYLRSHCFGCLQKSAWITPDPVDTQRKHLADGEIDVRSLVWWDARPCAGESDEQIVAGAWSFSEINSRYRDYSAVLDHRPTARLTSEAAAEELRRWATLERRAWSAAVNLDPLLPERLLPTDYLGQHAWRRRIKALADAGRQIREFTT